ncbi:MAG: phosphoribosylglycinamide formyltransferase [Candidatus Marinimicrobia bacterium]|nr:phosphoribosylglycinamide formyltransferase [Candidatus Neomarinimicrobiota bacterium]
MRIAIFASGGGSNAEAIIRAASEGRLSAEVGLVVSNNPDAAVLQRAKALEVNYTTIDQRNFDSEESYISALFNVLDENGIDFIALAGYLKLVQPKLINKYKNKITNIHPALLPSFGGKGFYGKKVHEAVLEAGCKVSGVTVHLVSESYDRGPIISQLTLPVLADDNPESLAARVLKVEHQIYPEALQLFAEGRVKVTNNITKINDKV